MALPVRRGGVQSPTCSMLYAAYCMRVSHAAVAWCALHATWVHVAASAAYVARAFRCSRPCWPHASGPARCHPGPGCTERWNRPVPPRAPLPRAATPGPVDSAGRVATRGLARPAQTRLKKPLSRAEGGLLRPGVLVDDKIFDHPTPEQLRPIVPALLVVQAYADTASEKKMRQQLHVTKVQ